MFEDQNRLYDDGDEGVMGLETDIRAGEDADEEVRPGTEVESPGSCVGGKNRFRHAALNSVESSAGESYVEG